MTRIIAVLLVLCCVGCSEKWPQCREIITIKVLAPTIAVDRLKTGYDSFISFDTLTNLMWNVKRPVVYYKADEFVNGDSLLIIARECPCSK